MIKRIQNLDERVPITFIYGQNTWMDRNIGEMVKKERQNSIVHIEVNYKYYYLTLKTNIEFFYLDNSQCWSSCFC